VPRYLTGYRAYQKLGDHGLKRSRSCENAAAFSGVPMVNDFHRPLDWRTQGPARTDGSSVNGGNKSGHAAVQNQASGGVPSVMASALAR